MAILPITTDFTGFCCISQSSSSAVAQIERAFGADDKLFLASNSLAHWQTETTRLQRATEVAIVAGDVGMKVENTHDFCLVGNSGPSAL
jgi:hypothetical protein